MKKTQFSFIAVILFYVLHVGPTINLFPKKIRYIVKEQSPGPSPRLTEVMKAESYKNTIIFYVSGQQSATLQVTKPTPPCPTPLPCPPTPCEPGRCNEFDFFYEKGNPGIKINAIKFSAELKEIKTSNAFLSVIKNSKTKKFVFIAEGQ